MEETHKGLEELVAMGREFNVLEEVEGSNGTKVAVHDSYKVIEVDPEKGLPRPMRRRGSIEVNDLSSFIAYVEKHKSETGTLVVINSDISQPFVKATLDHHGPADDQAGWKEHTVTFTPKLAPEFLEWTGMDRKKFDQETFAQWVEDHIQDIAEPAGAELREMVLAFQIHKDVSFESSRVLENGQIRLHYSETVSGRVGSGELEIPKAITLGIPVFANDTERVKIVARFRYRLERNQLSIWYELERPDRIRELAFRERVEPLKYRLLPALVIYGKP